MQYRILLAEDSPIIQKVVGDILQQEGFEVNTISNGDELLRELDSFNPHIVLVSTDLHSIDGYDLCSKIKIVSNNIPIILLSGAYEPFDEERARVAEANDHILKPFEACDLVGKIKKLLNVEGFESYNPPYYQDDIVIPQPVQVKPALEAQLLEPLAIGDRSLDIVDKTDTVITIENEIQEPQVYIAQSPTSVDFKENEELSMPLIDKELANLLKQPLEDIFDYYLKTKLSEELSSSMRERVNIILYEIAPKMLDEMLRQKMTVFISSLTSEIESEIKKTLPEIIEKIIKKRLEKVD